ncbi:MAG: type II toxin-antitoxin system VapC family toxin [Chloroflexi bacterium]|nr:type II toxin-antitoxin system VapC family toxin [Chloroflexota bacterium]
MTTQAKLVVDASVAVKWYVPETGSDVAAAVLARPDALLAPEFLVAEFGNVLWKKVRRLEMDRSEAEEIIDAFLSSRPVDLRPVSHFLPAAFDIAVRWSITVYDALYLAVAVAESSSLVTADEGLTRALRGTVLEDVLFPLTCV